MTMCTNSSPSDSVSASVSVDNNTNADKSQVFVVFITGVSNSGKTVLSNSLLDHYKDGRVEVHTRRGTDDDDTDAKRKWNKTIRIKTRANLLCQDDFYKNIKDIKYTLTRKNNERNSSDGGDNGNGSGNGNVNCTDADDVVYHFDDDESIDHDRFLSALRLLIKEHSKDSDSEDKNKDDKDQTINQNDNDYSKKKVKQTLIIVEGAQLLSQRYYDFNCFDLFCVLNVSEEVAKKRRASRNYGEFPDPPDYFDKVFIFLLF